MKRLQSKWALGHFDPSMNRRGATSAFRFESARTRLSYARMKRACLTLLSGRRHTVYTAVSVIDAHGTARHRLSSTILTFKRLSEREIADYLISREWHGKAGGYAVQGRAEAFVRFLSGSHSGVIGLPLFETRGLLLASGIGVA